MAAILSFQIPFCSRLAGSYPLSGRFRLPRIPATLPDGVRASNHLRIGLERPACSAAAGEGGGAGGVPVFGRGFALGPASSTDTDRTALVTDAGMIRAGSGSRNPCGGFRRAPIPAMPVVVPWTGTRRHTGPHSRWRTPLPSSARGRRKTRYELGSACEVRTPAAIQLLAWIGCDLV